jgi:hypothetical protein
MNAQLQPFEQSSAVHGQLTATDHKVGSGANGAGREVRWCRLVAAACHPMPSPAAALPQLAERVVDILKDVNEAKKGEAAMGERQYGCSLCRPL